MAIKEKEFITMKTKSIKGIIYKVYFETLWEVSAKPGEKRDTSCVVIASNVEDAIAKVKAAFPREKINSIHNERNFSSGPVALETILL